MTPKALLLPLATRTIGGGISFVIAATLWCSLGAVGPASAQHGSRGGSSDSSEVVARVGERTISVGDLEAALAGRAGRARESAPLPGEQRGALERRIDQLLVEEVATQRGIPRDPRYLAERAAIYAEAEEKMGRLQRRLLLEQLAAEIEVSEAELKERMQGNPRRFQTRRIHLRRLVVADEAAARAAAERIAEGESFAEVAADVSTDAALRKARGDLGAQALSELPPRLASRARGLATDGAVSEPFRAEGQWNLIQRVAGASDVSRTLEEVRGPLEQELRARKAEKQLAELIAKRRTGPDVSIDENLLEALAPPPRERKPQR